jgi:site-specific DNA recombinase
MTMTRRTIRFASWERVSTEDRQDPESSRAWQYARGKGLIEPHGGVIVAEFFDIDKSRSIPPQRRPEARALIAALAERNRGFDAVVVGEPQRAFYGSQFGNTFPLFEHYGVPLWVPEVGGPIDPLNEAHDLIMSVFGGVSKGERNRIRIRVRAAMAVLAEQESRFLGGRPPYGYLLADAGPHPNPVKAADGKRLRRLAVDEPTAAIVRRTFAEFLAGFSRGAIAARLTADGIPCPSANDPERNTHRVGAAWSRSAADAILRNPRYTGRQVWSRQRKDEVLIDVTDVTLGYMTKMRWNNPGEWIYSDHIAHPAIIDDQTFTQAQQLLASPKGTVLVRRPYPTDRPYALRGLLSCGLCGRRMHGSWNNNQAYYRCRLPRQEQRPDHPRGLNVREAVIVPPLHQWLASQRDHARLPETAATAITSVLGAPPADRAAFYTQLGLRLIYHPDQRTMQVRMGARQECNEDPTAAPASLQGQLAIEGLVDPLSARSTRKRRRPRRKCPVCC